MPLAAGDIIDYFDPEIILSYLQPEYSTGQFTQTFKPSVELARIINR